MISSFHTCSQLSTHQTISKPILSICCRVQETAALPENQVTRSEWSRKLKSRGWTVTWCLGVLGNQDAVVWSEKRRFGGQTLPNLKGSHALVGFNFSPH